MRSLTSAEGVDVLIKLEAHHSSIVVNNVGLTVPGARHHLLPAIPLEINTNKQTSTNETEH